MKRKSIIIFFITSILLMKFTGTTNAQTSYAEALVKRLTTISAVVINGDTMPHYVLNTVY